MGPPFGRQNPMEPRPIHDPTPPDWRDKDNLWARLNRAPDRTPGPGRSQQGGQIDDFFNQTGQEFSNNYGFKRVEPTNSAGHQQFLDNRNAWFDATRDWWTREPDNELYGLDLLMSNIRQGLGGAVDSTMDRQKRGQDWVESTAGGARDWLSSEPGQGQGQATGAGGGAGGGAPSSLSAEEKFLQFMETYDGNQTGMGGDFLRNSSDSGDPSAFMRERQMQGGTAGYDNRGAVAAYFDQMRGRVEGEYNNARGDIGNVYDQAADMMKPMAGQSAAAYTDAINAGAAQSESLIADTQERINADAASRASSFAELGISGDGRLSETSREAERGVSDIGANSSNWGGLMNAFSVGQQSRLNQDYVGAGDAKVMAQTDLTSTYQDYLRAIQEQESAQMADAYQPGTPGEMGPEFWETLPKSVQEEYWNRQLGYPTGNEEEPYMPELQQLEDFMLRTKVGTIDEINFMYDWMAMPPADRDPQDKTNPLWNQSVLRHLESM